ncbi:MAG: Brp/Blh family beta-carotene 15,15'-dioxygenase [Halodesulfurarchaeum sp.]
MSERFSPRPGLEAPLRRLIREPAYVVLAVGLGLALLSELPQWLRLAPLGASVLLLGLPHGAIDHLAPARAAGAQPTRRTLGVVGGVYLVAMSLYTVAWLVVPVLSFGFFILMTWFHWGQGDLYVVLAEGTHLATRTQRLLCILTRGALPMLVPLVAFPDVYRRVAGLLIDRFEPGAAASLAPLFTPEARAGIGLLIAFLIGTHVTLGWVHGGGLGWRIDAAETIGLAAFFTVVPPIFAIGLYFTVWHSARHLARLAHVDAEAAGLLRMGKVVQAINRVAKDAAPLTLASLAVLGVLWVLVPLPPSNPAEGIGLYLVFIAVLTLPHVLVVSWMDHVEGVWRP